MVRRPGRQVRAPSSQVCVQPAHRASCVRSRPDDRAVYNCAPDAGHRSQTFASSETWRKALLSTAAAGALLLGYGRRAYANCAGQAPTLTCTGDITGTVSPVVVNGGINVAGTVFDTLDVNNLDAPITPISGTNGINFDTSGDVTITSDADIRATGNLANGIRVYASGLTSSVTITSSGDVTSDFYGINVYNHNFPVSGDTYVRNDGTIKSKGTGISVGAAGDVTVVNRGVVNVTGTGYGIGVRSYGTGDVNIENHAAVKGQSAGIYAYANVGSVTIKSTGDVMAGANAVRTTASNSTITLYSGNVHGSSNGVWISGNATLNNFASLSGDVNAVFVGGNTTTINNDGTIAGNVYTGGGGAITFDNKADGIFNPNGIAKLGTGTLTNSGTLSPYGTGIGTTVLTGDLTQTASGVLAIDVDMTASKADEIDMGSSGTASLSGGVALNFENLTPVPQDFTILSDASSIPVQSLGVLNPAALTTIAYPTDLSGTDVVLTVSGFDFAPTGLNQNQTNIGEHLNGAFGAGGGLDGILTALASLTSMSSFANALDQLSPEIYGDTQLAALYASLDFSGNLLSCKMNGADTAAINREGECLWVGAKVRFLDNDETSENIRFDETAGLFAAGAQVALDPVWRLGFGAGYQTSTLETATGATSDGDMLQGGVALKYNPGALVLAGVLSGGRGWYDTTRPIAFGNFSATAEGDHTIDILSGRLHASYVLGAPSLYFKPMVDAAVTQLDLGDFSETGAGAAGLVVNGGSTTVFSVSPALEIGTEWWLGNGTLVRPFLRGGVTWLSDDDVTVSASFAGTPAGVSPFTIRSKVDQVQADVAAGVEMINSNDSALRLTYDGKLGDTTQIHSVALKGSVKF